MAIERTDTELSMMKKAILMIEEVVPGNNLQGMVIPSQPELVIKKKGTAVTQVKITLVFDLDIEVLDENQGQEYEVPAQ